MSQNEEEGDPDEEIYVVEEILDYDLLQVDNNKNEENYDPTLGSKRWEVRYLVKWKNYDAGWNSYEPRSCFVEWDDAYDAKIRLLQKRDKTKQSPSKLEKKGDALNKELRAKLQKKKDKAAKPVKRGPKVKVEKDQDVKGSKLQRAGSASTSSSRISPYPSTAIPKSRTTRNSFLDADSTGLATFMNSENAPAPVRKLAFSGLPKRDAQGNLVASSDTEDEKPVVGSVAPEVDLGWADDDSESDGGGGARRSPPPVVPAAGEAPADGGGAADGFAEDFDVDMGDSVPLESASIAVAGDHGYADSDHEEQPAMDADDGAPGASVGGADALGFAENSDEEQPGLGFAEDDSEPDSEDVTLVRRPPSKQKGKGKEVDSAPKRSKKTTPRPPEPKAVKKKADAPKASKKRPRVVNSDSDLDDRPLVSAPGPAPPMTGLPKMGLQGLKFKKHSELAQAAPAPAKAPPAPIPAPTPSPAPQSASPPLVPPIASAIPVQRLTSNDPSRDPRRRPSSDVDGRSQSDKTSDSTKKAQVDDPFNKGVVRPVSVNGFVPLNTTILENLLKASNFFARQGGAFNPHESLDERVRKIWRIGDPLGNFFDFDAVMREGGPDGRPRTAFIFASQKDEPLSKESRAIKSDYIALQLVLSTIPGVKQADNLLAPSVSAVFVHVSDIGEIGRYPTGKLAGLEALRERPIGHTIFIVFGEREKVEGRSAFGHLDVEMQPTKGREKVFEPFWSTTAAVTFTPSAFYEQPGRFNTSLDIWSNSRNRWPGQRDIFSWAHVSYLLPGGPFERPPEGSQAAQALQAPDQLARRQTFYDFLSAARSKKFALVQEVPKAGPHPTTYFPSSADRMEYDLQALNRLAAWLPRDAHLNSVDQLQRLAAIYRSQYLHM
ncbi:hypothetical protein BCR35DRAFT_323884 [Leucosporidium creatinivorum]|uniref:Chromo domain-containing protein n=1 Tax=Leucosporidium creatinivorum TaxID=106004 RepID=A0A1Y2G2V0_9BASI|nr:hypothetical protein BCR35DRAFT_323884 [Leucosporidium creatinivorum]